MFDRFESPWMLLLAPLALVVLPLAWRIARGRGVLFPRTAGTRSLGGSWRTALRPLPPLLRVGAVVLLAVVAARPQDVSGRRRERTEGVALQLVIDRSGSMDERTRLDGSVVTRIDAVKRLATEFVLGSGEELRGREGDLLGVIAFDSYADTICPLIRDHGPIPELIDTIRISPIENERGTAIGDAVALASARLREVERAYRERGEADGEAGADEFEIKSKVIVLLTDGDDRDSRIRPEEAARLAQEWGIRIYAIGIGLGLADESFGDLLGGVMRADMRTLNMLADTTDGKSWAVSSASQLRDVYAEIDELERTRIEQETFTFVEERYRPFAIAGVLVLLLEVLLRVVLLRRTVA
ncbi:MAG: VWA domain-containing protein [Planctomycetota bacterium]